MAGRCTYNYGRLDKGFATGWQPRLLLRINLLPEHQNKESTFFDEFGLAPCLLIRLLKLFLLGLAVEQNLRSVSDRVDRGGHRSCFLKCFRLLCGNFHQIIVSELKRYRFVLSRFNFHRQLSCLDVTQAFLPRVTSERSSVAARLQAPRRGWRLIHSSSLTKSL